MPPVGELGSEMNPGAAPEHSGPSPSRAAEASPATPAATSPARDPSISIAHAAMQSLLGHRISPSPENYLVWFCYHADAHSPLREAVDERHASKGALEQADLDELHAQFCAGEPHALVIDEVSRQLEAALSNAAGMLDTAHDHAARYGNRLEGLTDTLAAAGPKLNDALRRILADTQTLCRNSRNLAHRLAERAREAEALRGALQEARRAAATDALTGLPNRRAFEEALAEAVVASEGEDSPLCLIMLDIDHFKLVNDRYGHPAGDAVLRGVADTLREWARPEDRLARVGGEEFAVILTNTCREAAGALAEALRRAFTQEEFLTGAEGQRLSITISLGVAQRAPGETGGTLMIRADASLYSAKKQGRDRVVMDLSPRSPRDEDSGPEPLPTRSSNPRQLPWR
jgi:diguanylate cyclase